MKISVITLHTVNNYGSALQTYATQNTLSKMGFLCSGDSKQYQEQQEELIGKIRVDASGLLSSPEISRNLKVKILSLYFGKYGFYCVQKVSDWMKQIKAGQRYHV